MAKRNNGENFLFSDDCGFINGDDEGGESYRYSDGSGYFTDSSGSRTSYDADDDDEDDEDDDDEDDEDDDDSDGSSLREALDTLVSVVMVAKAAAQEREQEAQRERARIRSEKRRAWRKKHRKGIAITILISVLVVLSLIGYYEIQKLIPMGYSSGSLEGLKYTEVVRRLKESGFSNVHTKEIPDLTVSRDSEENLVTNVKLMFGDSFDENTKYPSNLWITVVYHTVELYRPPMTSKEAKGMNYLDAIKSFESAGFTNITTSIEYDIVTGWFADKGEVKSVTINGDSKFDSCNKYRPDAQVMITYHMPRKDRLK